MEKRVAELERYLGIDQIDPDAYGLGKLDQELQLETLDKKAQKLDDFIRVIEDKHYILGELFGKYE